MNQSRPYASPKRPAPRPTYHVKPRARRRQRTQPQTWLLGSLALAALALVPQDLWSQLSMPISTRSTQSQSAQPWQLSRTSTNQTCQTMANADQRLSRAQLTQFLSIAQNSSQANVHETIAPPYCVLSKAHEANQREAYPLAFDPETWFVVKYEQGLYKGYDFVFQP
ncbi:hypothetical protein N836_18360 [Leptolyngbya sp. Heron Island J]|uniref:hypothetical protein n=1 Tax=Leptolyngbya sp. Heron Island J TaxID=1385935 RepID=UPI0003B9ACAE|nr:hypothetical protein [Leptolyngbya sp. Heron Island J]ESA34212.1 hypothetical protein N836_18360 [Leptolyngbya sp. Heron Island J]